MKLFCCFLACLCLKIVFQITAQAAVLSPFNACTFYAPPFKIQSFGGGSPRAGCAQWSVVRGRSGCRKVKGTCPFCVIYPGDHLEMWLPEFFIEVTSAPGESLFTVTGDGALLATHLKLGMQWWKASTLGTADALTRSQPDGPSQSQFWHARVLVMPYANLMGSFAPLPPVSGTEAPTCYGGLSEFFPAQWNLNTADGPFAFAWSAVGNGLCNMPAGATLNGGIEAIKGALGGLGGVGEFPGGAGEVCARPVGATESAGKNGRPQSDALAPLTLGPTQISSKLCMGSWGNLLPRTGWATTADPFLSAMQAAYKFSSLTADLTLNDSWKVRDSDKWQIVYPLNAPATCFKPGATFPLLALPPLENVSQRFAAELSLGSKRKGTYLIAVWRKRETCEEPFEAVGGWSLAHKANLLKNEGICSAVNSNGGWK